jgi:hypothetical protein
MFTNIFAYSDSALRGVLMKSCHDMSLNNFVQYQLTSALLGRLQVVSVRLRKMVAATSQCVSKALIEI